VLAYLDWNEHSCSPFEHFGLCDETNHIPVGLECTMSAALNGIEVAFEFSTDMPRQLIVVHQLFQTRLLTTFARYFAHIVRKYTMPCNEVGVEILNFEVVYLNRFLKLFGSDSINICLSIVRIDETAQIRIVVPATQIVQTGFFVKDTPAIPEGLQRAQCSCQGASLADHLTPSIAIIRYHFGAVAVNQTNDVALQAKS